MKALSLVTVLLLGLFACKGDSSSSGSESNTGKESAEAVKGSHGSEAVPGGQDTTVVSAKTPTQIDKPFLFSVAKEGTIKGYLLGTFHLGVDARKSFPPYVWDKLKEAKVVCSEVDTSDPELFKAFSKPSEEGSLKDELGPETWKKFEDIVGAPMAEGLKNAKPMMAMSLLMLKDLPMTEPMDSAIVVTAKANKSELHYLETAQFQVELLDSTMKADALKEIIDNYDRTRKGLKDLHAAYLAGDEAKIESLFAEHQTWGASSDEEAKDMLEKLLYARNRDWIPKIEGMFEDGTTFCAVGAGHLVGEEGLVALFAGAGYEVQRVSTP